MVKLRVVSFSAVIGAVISMLPAVARAASVQEVNAKKKTVTVELEEDETMEKDAEVCFFTEKGRKVDCGTVTRVKGTAATIKLKTAKKMKSIKPGMLAKVGSEPPGKGEAGEGGDKKGAAAGKGGAAGKMPLRIWGLALPSFATPSTYKKIAFAAPTTDTPETLWSQDGEVKSALIGLGLGVGIPLGGNSLNLGLRYRTFTPSVIDADYVQQRENPYVSTEQKASALGIWIDFQYLRAALTSSLSLDLTGGIDIDMSTVTVTATKKDDSGQAGAQTGTLAEATSKLSVASLRLGAGFEFMFIKMLGARFGLDLAVPLAEFGKNFSGKLDEAETRKPTDPAADLQKALDHKKGGVSIGLNVGLVLAF